MAKNPKVKFGTDKYDYDMICIGAGIGGLATSALMAKEGLRVLVLEQSERIGGCCSTYDYMGYKLDVGASIVEIIDPMKRVFEGCGENYEDYLDLIPCDPIYSFITEKGERFSYPVDWEKTEDVISKIDPKDGEQFKKFAKRGRKAIEKYMGPVLAEPMQTIGDALKLVSKYPGLLPTLAPYLASTHETVIKKYFRNPDVLGSMAFQSFFVGAAPELCPGMIGLVALTEHYGIWYPKGGMIAIPEGIARVGKKLGVEIELNTLVDKILLDKKNIAKGVRTSEGREITAPVILSNVNAITAYNHLVGRDNLPWHIKIGVNSYSPSMGCPMIYLGLDRAPDLDAHHTMMAVSTEDMNRSFYDYKSDVVSSHGCSLACWPTDADPDLAPEGHHIINFIYNAPVPHSPVGSPWDNAKGRYIEEAIDFFDEKFSPGIKKHITFADASMPPDFERRLLSPRGAIYGLDFDLTSMGPLRPRSRSGAVKNLYLAGASTHMSGGIPTVMSSSLITSSLIKEDHC